MAADHAPDDGQKRDAARIATMPARIRDAHKHAACNASEIGSSDQCGCFYCLAVFAPAEIVEWIEEREEVCEADAVSQTATAKCPHCGIDSVIGSASGFPVDVQFLKTMNSHWF